MTFTIQDLHQALAALRSDILTPMAKQKFTWVSRYRVLLLHGNAFGACQLGTAEHKRPDYGFSIKDAGTREECTRLLALNGGKPISVLVVLDQGARDLLHADRGLDALQDVSKLMTSGGKWLVPAELFVSRIYGEPLPRLRNPTLVTP